ncbi:MAG: hypothetical protein HQ509_02155 [Candidatus Marinimicrobia bacterium]|nr:hypothetical protein [Candidatus Neomarinimicrobiota bacterium]
MSQTTHSPFNRWFIRISIIFAFFAGFSMGAHIVSIDGFFFPQGKSYFAIIQTHGYIQFMGWIGLFIMGVSLYFFPRISHIPIEAKKTNWILGLISVGLTGRYLAHNTTPYISAPTVFSVLNWIIFLSTVTVWIGVLFYVGSFGKAVLKARGTSALEKLNPIKGFMFMTLLGWVVYNTVQVGLTWEMLRSNSLILDVLWNEWSLQAFTLLVVIPICFAVSVRTFPLYLRLAPIRWQVEYLAMLYAIAIAMELLYLKGWWTIAGMILRSVLVIWFIWKIDILTRFKAPWTHYQKEPFKLDRQKQPRDGYPDYGEWGRFELLVYSAYFWLAVAMILDIFRIVSIYTRLPILIYPDAVRHLILLGFATMLIFGMAPRMIPGFMKKKMVAKPHWVIWTFWIGNISVIMRVIPIAFTGKSFTVFSGALYGLSGIFVLIALVLFSINMWKSTVVDS